MKIPVISDIAPAPAIQSRRAAPTNDFEPFCLEEIEQSIPARFEQQARRYPNRLAVKSPAHRFTYAELNEHANCVAHAILAECGDVEEPVALLLDQGAPLIGAIKRMAGCAGEPDRPLHLERPVMAGAYRRPHPHLRQ